MSKVPSGRPVAPGVDPIAHVPDKGDNVTKTQNPETLNQQGAPAATDANPVVLNDDAPVNNKDRETERALPGNGETADPKKITVRTKIGLLMDPYSARHIDDSAEGTEVPVTTFITDELAEGGRLERV